MIGNAQQTLGHCVEALCFDAPNSEWLAEIPFQINALGAASLKYGFTKALVPWLLSHARSYNAIFVHGLWQYASFGAWRALRRMNIPYYVFPHGMLDPWFKKNYPLKHLKKWLYWPWSDYRVLRDARAVLFTSEQERRDARRSFWLYRCVEKVVSLGTVAPAGDPLSQRDQFLRLFPELAGKRIILFLGRLHEKKGCELLIHAFARLKKGVEFENARLVMAGSGSEAYTQHLHRLAPENATGLVTWTGLLSGDLKWGAFHAAEVFALPSHQENFGIAVSEALSTGRPVLISNKVNIHGLIRRDGAGLVENDDLPGTSALLSRWFSLSDEERARMSACALRCFNTRFEATAAARSILEVVTPFGSGDTTHQS